MKLLIATNNEHKREELQKMLEGMDIELLTLRDFPDAHEVDEDRETFEGNARKKASEMAQYTGLHTMADDSGLCVDALDGRPGVRSARYAGPNPTKEKLCRKLLGEMEDVPDEDRTAAFHCCAAFARPSGEIVFTVEGTCDGTITHEMRGEEGFGYDPVFLYSAEDKTFAEMAPGEKNSVSHRANALKKFRDRLEDFLAGEETS